MMRVFGGKLLKNVKMSAKKKTSNAGPPSDQLNSKGDGSTMEPPFLMIYIIILLTHFTGYGWLVGVPLPVPVLCVTRRRWNWNTWRESKMKANDDENVKLF